MKFLRLNHNIFNKRYLLLYSFIITTFLSYKFITKLTPKLAYFLSRSYFEVVLDFLFFLLIWIVIFFICFLIYNVVKVRFRNIVFWVIGILSVVYALVSSKILNKVFILDCPYKCEEKIFAIKTWLYINLLQWIPDKIQGSIEAALAAGSIAVAVLMSFILIKKYKRKAIVFVFIVCLMVVSTFGKYHNTRFANAALDPTLFNKKIKSIVVEKNKLSLPQTVHVIFFDSFSYEEEIFGAGKIDSKKYPNFYKFLSQSYVFQNTRSAAGGTEVTFPRVIIGKMGEPTFSYGNAYLQTEGEKISLNSSPSIFSLAKKNNDAVYLTGWFHQYCHLFGKSINRCSDYSFYSAFEEFFQKNIFQKLVLRWRILKAGWLSNLISKDEGPEGDMMPIRSIPHAYGGGGELMSPRLWPLLLKNLISDYQMFMKENNKSALFFTHLNIPHIPIVFDAEGKFKKTENDIKSYKEELLYMDKLFGVLLEDIKKTADYNKSMIILTADHGFRGEEVRGLNRDPLHVPLVIKVPNQKERKDVNKKISTISLMQILENYYKARKNGDYNGLFENIKSPPNMEEQPPKEYLLKPYQNYFQNTLLNQN